MLVLNFAFYYGRELYSRWRVLGPAGARAGSKDTLPLGLGTSNTSQDRVLGFQQSIRGKRQVSTGGRREKKMKEEVLWRHTACRCPAEDQPDT